MADDESELLDCMGPRLDMETDPYLIRSVEKSRDFVKQLTPNEQVDGFQKAQYELLVEPDQQYQQEQMYEEMNIAAEGELMPVNWQHPREMQQYQGNNGNLPAAVHFQNWAQIEPVDQFEAPIIPEAPQDEAEIQRERNRGYSAQCLQRKKDRREQGKKDCEQLMTIIEEAKQQNNEKDGLLRFTVNNVLPPYLGGNNQIMDPSEVGEWAQYYESEKLNIEQTIDNNMNNDQNVINSRELLRGAEEKLLRAEYDLQNKKQRAEELGCSLNTIGSRHTRAKQDKEMHLYEHQIACNQFELEKQRRLSELLDYTWNYFRFPVSQILLNSSNDPYDYAKMNGKEYEMSRLHHFLLPEAG